MAATALYGCSPLIGERDMYQIIGALFAALASLLYAIEPSIYNLALQSGVRSLDGTLLRAAAIVFVMGMACLIGKKSIRLPRREALQLLLIGIIGHGLTNLLLSEAYGHMPVGAATVVHFAYPSVVCAAMAVIGRRRLGPLALLAMVLSIVGIFCISGGDFGSSALGILLAFASSLTYAFYVIAADRSDGASRPLCVRQFYFWTGSLLTSLVFGLVTPGKSAWQLSSVGLLLLCGLLFSVASTSFLIGVQRIGPSLTSFFSLLEPIGSVIFSTLIFGYLLSRITVWGCVIAILAVFLISVHTYRERRAPHPKRCK